MSDDFKPGLEGVIAFESTIAEPDKEGSALRYRGVDIEDLVGRVSFGNIWGLLVDDEFNPGLPAADHSPFLFTPAMFASMCRQRLQCWRPSGASSHFWIFQMKKLVIN